MIKSGEANGYMLKIMIITSWSVCKSIVYAAGVGAILFIIAFIGYLLHIFFNGKAVLLSKTMMMTAAFGFGWIFGVVGIVICLIIFTK